MEPQIMNTYAQEPTNIKLLCIKHGKFQFGN
jgi:hypothetical protein